MNPQTARLSDEAIQQVRDRAAQAASAELIPRIVFDVLRETTPDPAHTAKLQDVKLLLVEAYRSAGVSAGSLANRPIVA